MTKIILIRHGESEGNLLHTFCGHTDIPLTELGHIQAKYTARYLDRYDISRIYSSDLIRAFSTASETASRRKMDITRDKNVREIFAGDWEGHPFTELTELYPLEYGRWCGDIGRCCPVGGESVAALNARARSELQRIADENEGGCVAVFTHATVIRTMLCVWKGLPLDKMQELPWPTNASVSVVDYLGNKGYELECFSYDAHLKGAGLQIKDVDTPINKK